MIEYLQRVKVNKWIPLLGILLLGIVHGVIHIWITPLWQHYDEPGHFEYAGLIANTKSLPAKGDYDPEMRLDLLDSLVDSSFFEYKGTGVPGVVEGKPAWIGASQLGSSPWYYAVTAIPLFLLRSSSLETQLYAARIVSLGFLLVTLAAAYFAVREITPEGHPLQWLVPGGMALLPAFVHNMTSVNDDVGATAASTVFIWFALHLIFRKVAISPVFLTVLSGAVAFIMKSTAVGVLLAFIFLVLIYLWRSRFRVAGLIISAAILIIIGVLGLTCSRPAGWYTARDKGSVSTAPVHEDGESALAISMKEGELSGRVFQRISVQNLELSKGDLLTLGVWIWSDEPVLIHKPLLRGGAETRFENVKISPVPIFITVAERVTDPSLPIFVNLLPLYPESKITTNVYYDGVTLAIGDHTEKEPPTYFYQSEQLGTWGKTLFTNLVRNGSFESTWLQFQPSIEETVQKYSAINPSWVIGSLMDLENTGWYYKHTLSSMFRSFWAKFAWGNISLVGVKPYRLLGIISIVGAIGAVLAIITRRKSMPWDALNLLFVFLAITWIIGILRGIGSISPWAQTYIPVARYANPAIMPTMLMLVGGWWFIGDSLQKKYTLPTWVAPTAIFSFFIVLDIVSIYSIVGYFSAF